MSTLADPFQGLTSFTYDANGNLLTVQDPLGQTTSHTYDTLNRLATRTDPLTRTESFAYDLAGNLSTMTDRKTQTTTYTYDALSRKTQASYPDSSVTFTYDAGSRLTQVDDTADPHRPIVFTYDPLDRLLTETTSLGTVTYTYDPAGRRTSMTVAGQSPVTYTYDHNARLRTITQAPLNPVDLQYDVANRRTLLTLPNGVSTEYQYDLASRLTALIYRNGLSTVGDLQYSYDAAGNRSSVGGSFARMLVPDAVSTSTYDAGNRQLAFGAQALTYDDNGNRLTQTDPSGTITYTWDARNRLAALSGPGLSASFAYDGLGRRAQKTINGTTTAFRYDGLDAIQETGAGGDTSYLRTLSIDDAVVRTDAAGTVHYLGDALGSSVALTSAAGTVATTYTYEPFGRTETAGTPNPNPFRFTGREDDSTGLYYYRARYYDPGQGRFVGEDPLGLRASVNAYRYVNSVGRTQTNLYQYAVSSPLNYVDPLGLIEWPLDAPEPWIPPTDGPAEPLSIAVEKWAECYTRCIGALDPLGNLAERVATGEVKRRVDKYFGSRLPTRSSRRAWGGSQTVANRGMSILSAWQVGTSYGCMVSCASDHCNW